MLQNASQENWLSPSSLPPSLKSLLVYPSFPLDWDGFLVGGSPWFSSHPYTHKSLSHRLWNQKVFVKLTRWLGPKSLMYILAVLTAPGKLSLCLSQDNLEKKSWQGNLTGSPAWGVWTQRRLGILPTSGTFCLQVLRAPTSLFRFLGDAKTRSCLLCIMCC